jgi:hypothetical protein
MPESVARHCSNDEKLQLVPLKPVPKLAHQPPSARAAVAGRDKAANATNTSGIVRMNASSAACRSPIDRNSRAHSVSMETECALSFFGHSHFRTESQFPLFLKML